jgi:glutaconate CoA-transferase subunit A
MVTAVALAPMGAYPSYVEGFYGRDDAAYRAFEGLSRKPSLLADYIKSTVHDPASHEEFVAVMQLGRNSDV